MPFEDSPRLDPSPADAPWVRSEPLPPEPPVSVMLVPERPPHPGFWFSALWCVAFMLLQISVNVAVFVALLLAIVVADPDIRERLLAASQSREAAQQIADMPLPQAASLLVQEAAAVGFAGLLLRLFAGSPWRRRIALAAPSRLHFLLAMLAIPGMMVLSAIVYTLARAILPGFGYQGMVLDTIRKFPAWFGVLTLAVGPAVGEELMLRGFIGRGLVARYGVGSGILLTSLLFGLLHLDPPHVVATLAMGVVLHWVYWNARSILLPMMMHFTSNGVAVLSALNVPPFDGSDEELHLKDWPIYLAAVGLLAAVCWALYASRRQVLARPGGWQPSFPGVELPPSGTDAELVCQPLGWIRASAVVVTLLGFVGALVLSLLGGQG